METRDFICVCLGVASQKVDEICDKFNMDIDQEDVTTILDTISYYNQFGDALISYLFEQIIEDSVQDFDLDRSKFDYFSNGADSHLYYDKQPIYGWGDLQYISIEEKQ